MQALRPYQQTALLPFRLLNLLYPAVLYANGPCSIFAVMRDGHRSIFLALQTPRMSW